MWVRRSGPLFGPAQSIVVDVGADFADNYFSFSYLVAVPLPIKVKCVSYGNLRAPPEGTVGVRSEGTAERGVPARLRGQGGWGPTQCLRRKTKVTSPKML